MRAAYPSVPVRHGATALALLASVAAAAAGVWVSSSRAPATTAPPPSGAVLRAGFASLPMAPGWVRAKRSPIPGLERAPSAHGLYTDVVLDVRMPEDPSLLPARLLDATGGPSARPRATGVGGRHVWSYALEGSRSSSSITALALPTTEGVVTVACEADDGYAMVAMMECMDALAALELREAAPLRPTAETAAHIVAKPAIDRLDAVRRPARRKLASTRSPVRRARAARRIAAGFAAAARTLEPLERGTTMALGRSLRALARHHRSLAAASAARDAPGAARAGRAIDRGERRLAARLRAMSS